MSVVKSKRTKSRLEVIHNYYKLREQMTFVLFNQYRARYTKDQPKAVGQNAQKA